MYFHLIVHFLWKAKFSESKLSVEDLRKGKAMGRNRSRDEIYLVALCPGGSFPKPDRENYVKAPGAATHVVNDEDRMLLEAWIDQQIPADLFAK